MGPVTKVIVLILLLKAVAAFGQPNILHNGDFEVQFCPTCYVSGWAELEKLKYLRNGSGTPDLFSMDAVHPLFKSPKTFGGFQLPKSGQKFVGIGIFAYVSEIVLYAMPQKLKANQLYRFTVYVNLPNKSLNSNKYLSLGIENYVLQDFYNINNLNIYLQKLSELNQNAYVMELHSDTANWIEHSVDFRAKGGEKYLYLFVKHGIENVISATYPPLAFDITPGEGVISYYFFDNMSLVELPDPDNPEEEVSLELPNTFTPNADGQNDEWYPRSRNFALFELQVFNRYGSLVFQSQGENVQWDGLTLNGEPAAEGVYFVHLSATDRYGEVHNRQEAVHLFR